MNTLKKIIVVIVVCLTATMVRAQEENKNLYRGNQLYQNGKYEEAVIQYSEAMRKNPNNAITHYNLGNVLYKQKNYADAEKAFGRAIELTADTSIRQRAFYNTGVALTRELKLLESIAAYKRALAMNPADEDARFNLQKALEELRKKSPQENKQNQQQQKQPQPQPKRPPPNKKMLDQWLQSLRQKEQEVQQKMQQNKTRSVKQPDKDW